MNRDLYFCRVMAEHRAAEIERGIALALLIGRDRKPRGVVVVRLAALLRCVANVLDAPSAESAESGPSRVRMTV